MKIFNKFKENIFLKLQLILLLSIRIKLKIRALKYLLLNKERFNELKIEMFAHDKLPDVVLYDEQQNWLYFIEAVTSVGEINPKRIIEIEEITRNCSAGNIYITAFQDFKTYKKFANSLAWDTEVWLSEAPEHMIHLNGDRFMGPRD